MDGSDRENKDVSHMAVAFYLMGLHCCLRKPVTEHKLFYCTD